MTKEYFDYDKKEEAVVCDIIEEPKKKIDKWKLVKQVVGMAASGCASIVVSKYLKANMPEGENIFEKAVMGVGMYFITGIVGSKVAKYAESELDDWKESIVTVKDLKK